ncbi:hypothetical protein C0L91_01885 [Ligilactobacillus animalis]|nr:hypothetical protein C0L91_01885 [Ligilactobacillus animalis]
MKSISMLKKDIKTRIYHIRHKTEKVERFLTATLISNYCIMSLKEKESLKKMKTPSMTLVKGYM